MYLIAGAIQKPGVDEHNSIPDGVDTGREIGRSAPLFIHYANLDRVTFEAQQVFDGIEQPIGETGFFRAMHLGLDDVDGAATAIATAPLCFQIVQCDQAADDAIENALRRFRPVTEPHRRRAHQVTHVAHQQQTAAVERQCFTVGCQVMSIACERARHHAPTLVEVGREIALHQSQPVAVGGDFILGINRRDRILKIDDGRKCGFKYYIGQSGRILAANAVRAVNHQFDVNAMVAQQDGTRCCSIACVARQRRGVRECRNQRATQHTIIRHRRMASREQGNRSIEKRFGARDYRGATRGVITHG